jgi:hypothetical protein
MNKPQRIEAYWCGVKHNLSLTSWAIMTEKSRGYFEFRLKQGDTLQECLDKLQMSHWQQLNKFLYGRDYK